MDIKYILDVMHSGQNVDHCDVQELIAENARLHQVAEITNDTMRRMVEERAQQYIDRDTIINVLLSIGNMSEGVIADAIISAIGAQQSPAVAVPENTAPIPMLNGKPEITNRMKAECMGDFTITIEHSCSSCAYHGEQEDCEVCGGEIHYSQKHQVPWDTCKSIYKAMATVAIIPATQSPRITEQDAREIVTAWVKHVDDHDETVAIPDFEWSHHEWKLILRTLLNKLSGDKNGK